MITLTRLDMGTLSDLVTINDLLRQLHRSEANTLEARQLDACLDDPSTHIIVARLEKAIIGMGSIFFRPTLCGPEGGIDNVVVDEKYQGQGVGKSIGRRLIAIAQDRASAAKAEVELSLTSKPHRVAANGLYPKLGFKLVAKACGPEGTNLYRMMIRP